MRKAILHLLGDPPSSIPLQIDDDGKITHGVRNYEVVVEIDEKGDRVRFLLENQHNETRAWFAVLQEEWQRLHRAPDWRLISWFPFVTYERMTPRGKATLTQREDPLYRKRPDLLSSEFWQARLHIPDGSIVTTFTEFSCFAGQADAFCSASEWTAQLEQGTYTPAYTVNALVKEQPKVFRVTKGVAHKQSIWRVCSEREFARMIAQYQQLNGHSTILVRDLKILKALLPNTKLAGEHSPTGMPIH
jgi:hypothetical protein